MRRSNSAHASAVPRLQNMPGADRRPGNFESVPAVPRLQKMPTEEEDRIAILESNLITDVPLAPRLRPSLRTSASSSECGLITKEAELERHLLREDETVHAAAAAGWVWQRNRRAAALPRLNLPGPDLMLPDTMSIESERVVSVKRIRSRFSLSATLARFSKLRLGFGRQSNAVLAMTRGESADNQLEKLTHLAAQKQLESQQKHPLEVSLQPDSSLRDLGAQCELPDVFHGSMRNFFTDVGQLPPVILETVDEGDEHPSVGALVTELAEKRRPVPLSALPSLVEDPDDGLEVEQEPSLSHLSERTRELEAPSISANRRERPPSAARERPQLPAHHHSLLELSLADLAERERELEASGLVAQRQERQQSAAALAFPWKSGTKQVYLSSRTPESLWRQAATGDTTSVAPQPLQHSSQIACCPSQSRPVFPSNAALQCCQGDSVCNPVRTEPRVSG